MEMNRDSEPQQAASTRAAATSKAKAQAARPVPLRQGEPVLLQGHDGAQLCGELLWPQAGEPSVVVALSHAMMVDRRTLDQPRGEGLLSQLLQAGLAVFWFDQRGHGQSRPTASEGRRWSYDDLVADAGVVARYLAERFPSLIRVAMGHSLFGHVALAYQARASAGERSQTDVAGFDALVLIGGNVWLRQLEPSRWRWLKKRVSYALLQQLMWPWGYLPVRRLRMGTADEAADYLRQMGRWTREDDWTTQDGHSYLADLSQVTVPILSVAGAGDHLLAVPSCQLALLGRAQGPLTHWVIGRAFGDACDPGHIALVLDRRLSLRWQAIAQWTSALSRRSPHD